MSFVEQEGDSNTNKEMDGQGDEGVEFEEGDHKGRDCCSPKDVWCKEQQALCGDGESWEKKGILIHINNLCKMTFAADLGNRRKTGEDSANLHELREC